MSASPISRIVHYRIRTDTGTIDATPTWAAAEDTSAAVVPGTAFRVRMSVENTGTAAESFGTPDTTRGIVRCGYSNVAFSSTGNTFNGANAGSSADAVNVVTQRLTSATGSYATAVAGYDENEAMTVSLTNGQFCEVEFGVVLTGGPGVSGSIGGGETWTLQAGGLTNASAQVPTFTTADTNGTNFTHGNQLGGSQQLVANSATISMTTAADIRANNLVVVAVGCDNNGTVDGDNSDVSGVTCGGVAMTKAEEFSNTGGAANAGSTISVWWLQHTAQINSGSTITATFTTATTSGDTNVIMAREFIITTGYTVAVEAINTAASDAVTSPTSIDATTSNIECLRIAAHCRKTGPTSANIPLNIRASGSEWSMWWVSGQLMRITGSASTDLALQVEANISTGTGKASAPNDIFGSTANWSSTYVAFKATSAAAFTNFWDYALTSDYVYQQSPIGY